MIQQIKEIRKASENGRLVLFVGSGVSRNSGLPDWQKLTKILAESIRYSRCERCSIRAQACPIDGCDLRYDYTPEECIKIPEYAFHLDRDQYRSEIVKAIPKDAQPNAIHDMIFKLLPHHIITTNYDFLLENTKQANTSLYTNG